MHHFAWTALVTLLALLLYVMMVVGVGQARAKYKINAPAMTGDVAFERHVRVQANTLEWLPVFLPSLWLAAAFWSDMIAAGLGGVWILGRLIYMVTYSRGQSRSVGFLTQALATLALLIGALWSVAQVLLSAGGSA